MKKAKSLVIMGLLLALTTGQMGICDIGSNSVNAQTINGVSDTNNTGIAGQSDLLTITSSIAARFGVYTDFAAKTNVVANKSWVVTFNKNIDATKITKASVVVVDKNGNDTSTTITQGATLRQIIIKAPSSGYTAGGTYALMLIKTAGTLPISQTTAMKFVIADTIVVPPVTTEADIFGNVALAHETYLNYVADTNHDKSSFTLDETIVNPYESFEQYAASSTAFIAKYANNPTYSNVTDLDYYKKIKGLTINFDKVNNSSSAILDIGAIPIQMEDGSNPILKYGWLYNAKNPYLTSIWRVDTAKEIVDTINKNRMSKGLKALKLDADLTAISMWGAKRSYIDGVRSTLIETAPLNSLEDSLFSITGLYTNIARQDYIQKSELNKEQYDLRDVNHNKFHWTRKEIITGITPLVPKSTEKFLPSDDRSALYSTNLEKDLATYFNYSKPIKLINYSTTYDYTGEKIVNRLSGRDNVGLPIGYKYSMGTKYVPKNFNNNVYDKDMTNIGVGVIYERAANTDMNNGIFTLYIIVS